MSIDYSDIFLSFVLSILGRGRSFATVDWHIAMICHYVMYCLPVDNHSVRSGGCSCIGVDDD